MTQRRRSARTSGHPANAVRRAIGYVRISLDRPEETSTTTQEERIRAHCVAQGWELVDVIVEAGRSAWKDTRSSRPGWRKVAGVIAAGAADTLVVWKIDRAARNTVDTLNLVHELEEQHAALVSVTEPFDTATPTGKLMVTMLAALAEMESATKSERVLEWQDRRRAIGATPTGPRPYGYTRERNRLIIDEAEASVIRTAATSVLEGAPLRQVVRELEAAGVVGKSGKPISRRALAAILTNPTIVACREDDDGAFVRSPAWQPILERSVWDEVRTLLTDPSRRSGPGNGRRWLLSGIARCGRCTATMTAKPHAAGTRYSCPVCHLSIEAERTDGLVERRLLKLLDPETWRRIRAGRPATENAAGFEAAMAAITARFVADDIDAVELADLAADLRRQRDVAATPVPELPDVADVAKAWPSMGLEARRLVVSASTESLTILPWNRGTNRFDERRVALVPVP